MAPAEILPLLVTVGSVEFAIFASLLLKIEPVGAIFIAVPRVVVAGVPIVVALVVPVSIVGSGYDGSDECCAQDNCAQNQKRCICFSFTWR